MSDPLLFSSLPLHERLHKALDKLDMSTATPVQAQAIPVALERKDLQVSAETGSGKTAAFLLPILNHLLNDEKPNTGTRALILVPTRELARQVFKHCKDLASFTHLQAGIIMGGQEFKFQKALLRKNPEIIIATPGRLVEHINHSNTDFANLDTLVLDEADRMLDMGFSEDMLTITNACNTERQTQLFSATLNHDGVSSFARQLLNEPAIINLGGARNQHSNITQQILLADDSKHKDQLLAWLLSHETYVKALIFTNTKVEADRIGGLLRYHNLAVSTLHGDKDQDERNKVVTRLRHGSNNILVATDVAARGLDVKGIDLVINFHMPRSGDDYVHRIGRTGRAGEKGLAISLISSTEFNLMSSIERYLRVRFELRQIKELIGKYKGPDKLKSSGKAAGTKKKKEERQERDNKKNKKKVEKTKVRQKDSKNIGKRRKPKAAEENVTNHVTDDGFAPFKKRTWRNTEDE